MYALYTGNFFEFPRSIFIRKNLVFLELTGPIILNVPSLSSVWLPRLKILRLNLISYNESCWNLLSGCPVLEDLGLVRTGYLIKERERVKCKICLPTLKRLTIKFLVFYLAGEDYGFEIKAPALEYFTIDGDLGNVVFLEKPSNLVGATVDIHPYVFMEEKDDYGDRVLDLVRPLYNVKKLKLCSATTEWLHSAHDDNYNLLPMFHNLTRLDFEIECCYWGVLPHLLHQAPNLQVLHLDKFSTSTSSRYHDSHQSCPVEPQDVPRSVSPHLTTFSFNGFEGSEDQLKVIRHILNKARVLNTVTLTNSLGNYRNVENSEEEKSGILEKLSTYPKLSMSCQITFD